MDWIPTRLTYQQTGYFSRIITDYLTQAARSPAASSTSEQAGRLSPFYAHPVTPEGFRSAIETRKKTPVDRKTLVEVLESQYAGLAEAPRVKENISSLISCSIIDC